MGQGTCSPEPFATRDCLPRVPSCRNQLTAVHPLRLCIVSCWLQRICQWIRPAHDFLNHWICLYHMYPENPHEEFRCGKQGINSTRFWFKFCCVLSLCLEMRTSGLRWQTRLTCSVSSVLFFWSELIGNKPIFDTQEWFVPIWQQVNVKNIETLRISISCWHIPNL